MMSTTNVINAGGASFNSGGSSTAGSAGVHEDSSSTRGAPLGPGYMPKQINLEGGRAVQAVSGTRVTGNEGIGGSQADSGLATGKTKRRINKERKIRQLLPLQDLFCNEIKYPIYYIMTFPGIEINSCLQQCNCCRQRNQINTRRIGENK